MTALVIRPVWCCDFAGPQSGERMLSCMSFAAMFRGHRGEFQQSARRSGLARTTDEADRFEGEGWLLMVGLAKLSKRFLCASSFGAPMLQVDWFCIVQKEIVR